jgi:hypothetical protein
MNSDAFVADIRMNSTSGLVYVRDLEYYNLTDPCPVPLDVQQELLEGLQALIRSREAHAEKPQALSGAPRGGWRRWLARWFW